MVNAPEGEEGNVCSSTGCDSAGDAREGEPGGGAGDVHPADRRKTTMITAGSMSQRFCITGQVHTG